MSLRRKTAMIVKLQKMTGIFMLGFLQLFLLGGM